MANEELALPGGAKLNITTAPFADAHALLKALLAASKGLPIGDDPMQMDVSILKDALIAAATDNAVDAALWKCMERATYQGVKITRGLFDDPKIGEEARADYYLMAYEVIKNNCAPFFGKAFSVLRDRFKTPAVIPG